MIIEIQENIELYNFTLFPLARGGDASSASAFTCTSPRASPPTTPAHTFTLFHLFSLSPPHPPLAHALVHTRHGTLNLCAAHTHSPAVTPHTSTSGTHTAHTCAFVHKWLLLLTHTRHSQDSFPLTLTSLTPGSFTHPQTPASSPALLFLSVIEMLSRFSCLL